MVKGKNTAIFQCGKDEMLLISEKNVKVVPKEGDAYFIVDKQEALKKIEKCTLITESPWVHLCTFVKPRMWTKPCSMLDYLLKDSRLQNDQEARDHVDTIYSYENKK